MEKILSNVRIIDPSQKMDEIGNIIIDDKGKIKLTSDGRHTINIAERTMPFEREKTLSDVPMSNKIGHGGTKPDNSWKIEASKNFTIAPAYNKGPYMVVAKEDIKTAGRKV